MHRARSLKEWNTFAKENGHKSIRDMIDNLYWKRKLSSRQIAVILGITCQRLLQMMENYGIKRRSRGGPNR